MVSLLTDMKKFLLFFALISSLSSFSQTTDPKELQENARAYWRVGDYDNASILLIKAMELAPADLDIAKDLALNYYFQKENNKALDVVKPLLDRPDVDDQSFQIAGNIYKALEMTKEADAMIVSYSAFAAASFRSRSRGGAVSVLVFWDSFFRELSSGSE